MVQVGDHVADIGILDIEGKVVEAGPQVARVKWRNHNRTEYESYIGNDNLVIWGSEEHFAMAKEFPNRVWNQQPIDAPAKPPGKPLREAPVDLMALFKPSEET